MRKVALWIDEETLRLTDQLQRASKQYRSRSALFRAAIRAFARRKRSARSEERRVIRENKNLLHRQLTALVRGQANP
jgi:metal-responsive CopG/Arc/MetJ family transcriptional regulator